MKLLEAMQQRRAVRSYRPDPIEHAVLQELVEVASAAPSYMNLQPWSFGICADPAQVSRFDDQARQFLLNDWSVNAPFLAQREELSRPEQRLFHNAPALIVVYAVQTEVDAECACAMAAYGLMLAAHSMGLASCWVSQARPWLDSVEGHTAMGVPSSFRVIAPLVIGAPLAMPLSPGRFKPPTRWV